MRKVFLLAGALTLAACGGSDSTAPNPNAAAFGNYSLNQVNGSPPPVTIFSNSAGRIDVTGGSMSLRSDLSFSETRNFRLVYSDGTSESTPAVDNGTFSVTGSQITFTIPASGADPAFSYTGAVSGGVVTYTYNGASYRYQK